MKFLILTLIFLTGCSITGNATLEGPFTVTKVVDGDTLDLSNGDRVRFSGINTPETGECYYQEAKDFLSSLVLNKQVFLEKDRSDEGKYGRKLRYIHINDQIANDILVKEGYAKVYDKYKADTKRYPELKKLEAIAIKNNLGVWSCEKQDCLFVSSKNSEKYHTPNCKYAKKIKQENKICHKTTPDKEFSGC
ncbi:MAG: hypothetical protein CMH64_04615 [Nanoarchaeota archaeon]|nr:hypothetical protein [Nanoarchaeota archaeon]|tara:strand:+ start:747 stop:1322 length:576 start_codon:yes stop_codon:yes gene_type:complete